jgi:hypothetical protein
MTIACRNVTDRHTLHSLRGAYRRQLEEMAALGQWESDWPASIRATALLGSDKFIQKMLGVLKGDRREQTGLRSKERLFLDWPKITNAIGEVWGQNWDGLAAARGNGALTAAFFLGQRYAGLRLREMGELAGGLEYPAVNAAIAKIESDRRSIRSSRGSAKY